MSPKEKIEKFRSDLNNAVTDGIRSGLGTSILLIELSDFAFDIQMMRWQQRQEKQAREISNAIIPANGLLTHNQ